MTISNLGGRIVNNWLYPLEHGWVLIDTGYPNGYKHFEKNLARAGVALDDICYLFLTHAHDDHAGFLNDLLRDAPGLTVIASERAWDILHRGQNAFDGGCTGRRARAFCGLMKLLGKGEHTFPPLDPAFEHRFSWVSDATRDTLGHKLNAEIIETPGHTADSLSLMTADRSLFCGDAAMNGFPSVRNVTIWANDLIAYARSWQRMIERKPLKLYPGHGRPFDCSRLEKNLDLLSRIRLYPLTK